MYRRTHRGRVLLLAFVALSIAVITLDFQRNSGGPLERAKDVSAAIVEPIQRGLATIIRPVRDFASSIGEIGDLRERNAELEASLEEAEARLDAVEGLEEENETMREQLELDPSFVSMDAVAAEVIADVPSNFQWAVTIDRGSSDGIRRNMAVLSASQLVGRVIRVTDNTADVLLLVDPSGGAGAKVEGVPGAGFVSGNGGDENLTLELKDPEAEVAVGDEVFTSGFEGGIFPPSIPIGTVAEVSADTADPNRPIEVEPLVDFNDLQFVQVLTETGSELDRGDK